MFTEHTVHVRELWNGVMCLAALAVTFVFIHYIWTATGRKGWYDDVGVQAAAAISVLMLGTSLRSFSLWMEFLWLDAGWENTFWASGTALFLTFTALIV